jgi:hypothetical protein
MTFTRSPFDTNWSDPRLSDFEGGVPADIIDPNRIGLDIREEAWAKLGTIGCSHHERTLTRQQCEWLCRISRGRLGSCADEIYRALALAGFARQ